MTEEIPTHPWDTAPGHHPAKVQDGKFHQALIYHQQHTTCSFAGPHFPKFMLCMRFVLPLSTSSKETLTDSVQTSLFSVTLASPTTFPISFSRDAKDSWACKGGENKNNKKQGETTINKGWEANPRLSKSTSDTGNHCSRGNVVYARFAQGTNISAKIDMSPYNQHVAHQPACIWEQFYREALIVLCQVIR